MSYKEAAMVAQFILGTFFLSAVTGMIYMAQRRAREDRTTPAISTEQERERTQAVRILGSACETRFVPVRPLRPFGSRALALMVADEDRPRADRSWNDTDVQESFGVWAGHLGQDHVIEREDGA